MASASNILSVLESVDYEESAEEQWERKLQKLRQQCSKERTKRLEFAIEKCKYSVRDISFSFALNQVQNKYFTNFRSVLEENLKMQVKLVEKLKSLDWELVNGLWRFKIKTLQEQKEKIVQHFQKQRDLWEMKMRSIPEFNDIQRTLRLFQEKERKLLELQEQWKIQQEAVDNKYHRTNKHFQEINIALDSSEKIVTDLKQEAGNLEAEIKRLDASKLEEMRLIKDLEKDLKKQEHRQTKGTSKKENSKYYRRARNTAFIDVFNLSPFPVLKMEKITVKTLIEDRKNYAPMMTNTPEKLVNFPKQIVENVSQSEKRQLEKIEDIKLKPEKQIKILEHVILKSPVLDTSKGTVSEQNDSSLVVSVAESLSCKTAEILNISQNKTPYNIQDLQQSNEEIDTKDENKIIQIQARQVRFKNVLEENILKRKELNDEEREKDKRPKIVIEDKFKREENVGIVDFRNIFVNETKSSKIEEEQFSRDTDHSQKVINVGNVETNENRKFELSEFSVNKTSSNVMKRKSDKPSSVEDNLNPKQFKFKGDDSRSKPEFKPVQTDKISVGDYSGSQNDTDKVLRKAFELCEAPENTGTKSGDTEINLNDDIESFFKTLMTTDPHSKDPEKGSNQSSDDVSGWGAFGKNFGIGDSNDEDKGFFK